MRRRTAKQSWRQLKNQILNEINLLKLNFSINATRQFGKPCIHIIPKPATPARRRLHFLYQVILLHSGAVQLPFHRGLRNNIE